MTLNDECDKLNSFENLSSKVQFWKLDLPESLLDIDEEDTEELDLLCELVRNHYLKRLRQTLLDNLDATESYQKTHLRHIQQCVDICMAEMEKQALRRCMIASIYREGMSNMISKVKDCTKNSVIYVLLKHIIESDNQSSLRNKYFGSNVMTKDSMSIGVITEQNMNESVSTQTETCTNMDSNLSFNMSINNANPVNTSNVPPSSYDMKCKISESNIFDNLSSLLKSPNSSESTSDIPMEVNYNYGSVKYENSEQKKSATNDMLTINSLLRDLQDSPEYEQQCSKLDEHLITLGLTIENHHNSADNFSELPAPSYMSPNIVRHNKIDEILKNKFKSNRIAKSYELRKSMNELPLKLKQRLNLRFDYLFGNGHNYDSDPLSEEEERIIAHKRIVKMVVKFMTPYYKANRISRYLFKSLAKLISKNLMDRAYDPDEGIVARGVNEFFTGNRCIKTFEDIYQ